MDVLIIAVLLVAVLHLCFPHSFFFIIVISGVKLNLTHSQVREDLFCDAEVCE